MTGAPAGCPVSTIDPWSDSVLLDPYAAYRELRDLGPAVWLEEHNIFALARHAEASAALSDHQRFSSAEGVAVEQDLNTRQSILTTDPPDHETHRRPTAVQLTTAALTADLGVFATVANELTDRLVAAESFDAVSDMASPFSVRVVADLCGLPEAGRERLGALGERAFNSIGPSNPRFADGKMAVGELVELTFEMGTSSDLCPGTRGEQLVESGRLENLVHYTWPGIDTTVHALSSAVMLFAQHPDQWDLLRGDPSLCNSAFNEVLRMHAPVHTFSRVATETVEIGDVEVAEGQRIAIMFGAANRDERRYADPDRFDITRNARDHLGFGRGIHRCVGSHLALAEATALFQALIERVERFDLVSKPVWKPNNSLHGLESLPVAVTPTS